MPKIREWDLPSVASDKASPQVPVKITVTVHGYAQRRQCSDSAALPAQNEFLTAARKCLPVDESANSLTRTPDMPGGFPESSRLVGRGEETSPCAELAV